MKDKIDEYKRKLYSRKYKNEGQVDLDRMKKLKKTNIVIENNWDSVSERLEEKTNLYKYEKKGLGAFAWIFIISLIFFVLAIGVTVMFFVFKKNEIPLNQLESGLIARNSVDSGKIYEYDLNIENNTKYLFHDINIYVTYPEGVVDPDDQSIKDSDEIGITEVKPGEAKKIKKRIVLYGEPDEKKKIIISIDYMIKGYSAILNQKKEFSVRMETSPVFVKVNAPSDIMVNKEFDVNVEVSSNSNTNLKDVVLIATYPNGFEIIEYDPEAIFHTENKNIFLIPEIKIGEKKVIKLKAKLKGNNGDKKVLNFLVGSAKRGSNNEIGIKYFNTKEEILVKRPSLDLDLFCNTIKIKDNTLITFAQTDLECKYKLSNNLPTKVTNIGLELNYPDDLIIEEKTKVFKGYIDSNNNKILWNVNTDKKDYTVLKGGDFFEGEFSFRIKDLESLAGYVKNPNMKWKFILTGMNFDNKDKIGEIKVEKEQLVKINSDTQLVTETHYKHDEDDLEKWSPWENEGGPTPRVGQETTYALKWSIYNSFNKIKNVSVIGKLPLGVEYLGVKYPKNEYVSYDKKTRTLKWSIKKINPFIGYKTPPKTVYLKLSYIPTLADAGSNKTLVGPKILFAEDEYTSQDLKIEVKADDTRIDREGEKYDVGVVQK